MDDGGLERVLAEMRRRGFRLTPQRVALVRYIIANVENHESLREIHEKVSRSVPGISVSTVYHTLKLLEDIGVIKTFELEGRIHVDRPHLHLNIYCRDAGRVVDLELGKGEILSLLKSMGLTPRNIIVESETCPPSLAAQGREGGHR